MVHSVELLFDADTDAAVRQAWDELAQNGIRSLAGHRSPTNRPHVTLTVAGDMDDAVNDALCPLLDRLPFRCVLGAPMVFGGGRSVTLVRLVVPSADLLELQAEVNRVCRPHMTETPLPHAVPGHWTPHVTLARRIPSDQLPTALALASVTQDIGATAVGLRHWDGNARCEYPID
ncbi:2'-5' RNA ligase family protein [Mycobacterium sp. 236(2023)]|uniref:2'-5' RNA ligase family protein n=1 Tax=Mycobacterium sp. 236(2023) TaxID=3038163 RepID=UPI0024154294|nr:2'-5' RNA ligase family protein [Mycobacterium sp. 236(2023)]MDG4668855.1 2'-5' RNA ligase family protein [Mycobacterium sp. 236(2023)]